MSERDIAAELRRLLPEDDAARLVVEAQDLPDPRGALGTLADLAAVGAVPADPARRRALLTLSGFSPYLGRLLVQHPEFLEVLPAGGPAAGPRTREDLEEELARFQSLNAARDASTTLRLFKQREYLRIALADFLGTADLSATTRALSLLADVLLHKAVQMARAQLEKRFGPPISRDDMGHVEQPAFTILALGKLGGEELNYSSDIDLLYLFSRDGETSGAGEAGAGAITNKEFFTRQATEVTRLIAGRDPEGQVFRVDLGLRPGGRDGDLVVSAGAALAYYADWSDTWERQALIKARAAAGDAALGARFVRDVQPLVYPETPDPDRRMEIAAMKDRIDAQLGEQGRSETDIKLGRGGIRELEFAVQALQIEHGGRDPWLRQGNTLLALHRLAEKGYVGFAEYATLSEAYAFLRHLEHRLQLGQNRQTSTLPRDPEEWRVLARRMRLGDATPGAEGEALARHLERHRACVRSFYDSVLGRAAQREMPGPEEQGPDLWLDRLDDDALRGRLRRHGLSDPETVLRTVKAIRRLLQPAAPAGDLRRALRRGGPAILEAAARAPNPRRALENLERLLGSLHSEPGGIVRFLSHREIVAPTIRLLGRSDFLAGILVRQPGILWSLEDRGRILRTPSAEEYRERLVGAATGPGEPRARAGEVRRRHQELLATIAMRDINRQATLRETLKGLSNLADAAVEAGFILGGDDGAPPPMAPAGEGGLAVLGLGRLGYREMDYGSDLDLVFVRAGGAGETDTARRAASRRCEGIVRVLSTLSRDGQLYRVDLRLRPSGREGDIVTSAEALEDYFRRSAEIWEMQSFLKARPVAGDLDLGRRAVQAVEAIILDRARAMGPRAIASAIVEMRHRLHHEASRAHGGRPDVKLGEGGLLDIHFAIEYLQLRHGVPGPADKDVLRLLLHLERLAHLGEGPMRSLYEAYLFFRALEHQIRLIHDRPLSHLPADPARLAEIALALDPSQDDGTRAAARLLETFAAHAAAVRRVYESLLDDI